MLQILAQPLPQAPRLIYPELAAWLAAFSVLDVLMTCAVLSAGGDEMNLVARAVIEQGGIPGMIALKACGTLTVLAICEYIGRSRLVLGKQVLMLALALNILAVTMGSVVVGAHAAVLLMGM